MKKALISILLAAGACNLDSSLRPPGEDASLPDGPGPDGPLVDPVVRFAVGDGTACAIKTSGKLLCWGANDFGQLGVPPTAVQGTCTHVGRQAPCRLEPEEVPGIDDVAVAALGVAHTCAAKKDGTVWCWGINSSEQLGHASSADGTCVGTSFGDLKCSSTPTQVVGVSDAVQLVASRDQTCAISSTGKLSCWGFNRNGELGNGTTTTSHVPTTPNGMGVGVSRVSISYNTGFMCAVKTGEAFCWGASFPEGNLAKAPGSDPQCLNFQCVTSPIKINGLSQVTDIAVGERAACAAINDNNVRCWGSNIVGQLGTGSAATASGPTIVNVTGLTNIVELQAGQSVTCARNSSDKLSCWGNATIGMVADGNLSGSSCTGGPCEPTPLEVPGVTTNNFAMQMSILALDSTSNTFYAWGQNGFGELGHAVGTGGDLSQNGGFWNATPSTFTVP